MVEEEKQSQVVGTTEKIDLDEIMRKFDVEARYRTLSGWQALLVSVIAVAMSLFHLYTSGMGLLLAIKQGAVHLAFALSLIFLLYPASNKGRKDSIPWYDMALAIVAALSSLYLVIFFNDLVGRAGLPTTADLTMGFVLVAMLLEATRRVSNPILPGIAIFSLLYCFFGRYFPDMFAHRGFEDRKSVV